MNIDPEPSNRSRVEASRSFVQNVVRPIQSFAHTEASSGIALLAAALVAIVWVNSPWDSAYFDLWHHHVAIDLGFFRVDEPLEFWVNDGLMCIFFFVVGMEIKRELAIGELSSVRRAALPAAAALGGMIVPALIFTGFNAGGEGARGWGIPMATDIAFAVGVLALLGRRVPFGVKIFLLALAIVDDLGAIVVIAVFYTEELAIGPLALGVGTIGLILAANRLGIRAFYFYIALGVILWAAVLKSGVHPTVAGVFLGLLTPALPFNPVTRFADTADRLVVRFRHAIATEDTDAQQHTLANIETLARECESPIDRLQRALHLWASFVIVPVFALANSGVVLSSSIVSDAASSPITQGVAVGLVAGKFLGVFSFTWIIVRLGLCDLPSGASWRHMAGTAMLAGIGFTVSIFITGLAYTDGAHVDSAKIGILAGSLLAGAIGFGFLRFSGEGARIARPALEAPAPPG